MAVDRDAVLVREGSNIVRIPVRITDADGNPTDPTTLNFTLVLLDGSTVVAETYAPPTPTRIVRLGVGSYYFPVGDVSLDPLNGQETVGAGTRMALWEYVLPDGTSGSVESTVNVLPIAYFPAMGRLRLLADKAILQLSTDPDNPLPIGFTDSMLSEYLMLGLEMMNSYQPVGSFSLATFPVFSHSNILISAAYYCLLTSQTMLAIATDVDSYNDINGSFVIVKHPKLMSMAQAALADLDKRVPQFKMQYYRLGSALVEFTGRRFMLSLGGGMGVPGALPVFGR